jgi:hypothetical protein
VHRPRTTSARTPARKGLMPSLRARLMARPPGCRCRAHETCRSLRRALAGCSR